MTESVAFEICCIVCCILIELIEVLYSSIRFLTFIFMISIILDHPYWLKWSQITQTQLSQTLGLLAVLVPNSLSNPIICRTTDTSLTMSFVLKAFYSPTTTCFWHVSSKPHSQQNDCWVFSVKPYAKPVCCPVIRECISDTQCDVLVNCHFFIDLPLAYILM